jgi:ATP-dependent RNA helicase DeaD
MNSVKFEDLNLSKEIQKAVADMGFEEATTIQAQSIPYMLEGKDVIGQSQTGTGKTAAFGIPILETIKTDSKAVQALVLCPTRELAIQICEEMKKLAKYKRNLYIMPIYGGQSIDRQIQSLKRGVQIVVGTPGRVIDHMRRKTLKLDQLKTIILDEADEMLDMGFIEDIETILSQVPEERQTVMFSATMSKEITALAEKHQRDPKLVMVVHKQLTVPNIEQFYYELKEPAKLEALVRLLDIYNPKLSLVFCNTKRKVDELVSQLQTRGYLADSLHGDMKQVQRDRVMSRFRTGNIDILVATDVAARGIDVDDIEAVFNYDVPQDEEYYVHRIGRTARAGRTGKSFTFALWREISKLKEIQRYTKTSITRQQVPTIDDVEESRTAALIERIKSVIKEGQLGKYSDTIERLLDEEYTSMDIASALLKMVSGDMNKIQDADDADGDYGEVNLEGMARLFINIGKNQGITPKNIVGAIAGETGMPGNLIGSIDIFDKYTFVEVPAQYQNEVMSIMKDIKIKGNRINIEPANPKR